MTHAPADTYSRYRKVGRIRRKNQESFACTQAESREVWATLGEHPCSSWANNSVQLTAYRRSLRSRFRQQLTPSVRQPRKNQHYYL